jgi:hypothetical protein
MTTDFATKAKSCCTVEHDRLVAELETCDKMADKPTKWHRCARSLSRKSANRAKACMLRK